MEKKECDKLIIAVGGGIFAAAMAGGLIAGGGLLYGISNLIHPTMPTDPPKVEAKAPEIPKPAPIAPPTAQPALQDLVQPEPPKPSTSPIIVEQKPAANINIAVLDYRAIMDSLPEIKQMNQEMEAEYKKLQEEAKSLPDNEKNDFFMKHQEELMKLEQSKFEPIKKKVDDALDLVMSKHDLSGIVAKEVMIKGGYDITEEVKAELEK